MKKKLESDLIRIANRILSLKGEDDVVKMHAEVRDLYEKLSVLKFAYESFEDEKPVVENDSDLLDVFDKALNLNVSDNIEVEDKIYINLDEVQDDNIMEPGIETIKDIVAQMPDETHQVDHVFEKIIANQPSKQQDIDELTKGFKDMPVFEPLSKVNERKSLNNKINSGRLNIGLNDKIAFINHLFNGNSEDYNRVISQISTFETFSEAKEFIENMVKPDYNLWADKEEFESRFLEIIESKFE